MTTLFPDLVRKLGDMVPGLRGQLQANVPMAPLSWFRTGGVAQVLFTPEDERDLCLFMSRRPDDLPWTVIGLGSNLLVRDGGVPGIVIRLGRGFSTVEVEGMEVRAGAGAADVKVARAAADAGIDGFSFLRGIPGSIGGVLRMNGGAYGGETADIFVSASAVTPEGRRIDLDAAAMGFSYRKCAAPGDIIFTHAVFRGQAGQTEDILARMQAITQSRSSTQPVNTRTGGSTFKNPPGHSAWKLVDAAGCRGLTIGGAQVSTMHTNFLVNTGFATSSDIEALGEAVRERVQAHCGIVLEWEIRRIGVPA